WAWVMSMASSLPTGFCSAGSAGFPSIQGSSKNTLPLGDRNLNVPWPSQVTCTPWKSIGHTPSWQVLVKQATERASSPFTEPDRNATRSGGHDATYLYESA